MTYSRPAHVAPKFWNAMQPGEKKVISERAAESPEQRIARKIGTIRATNTMLGGTEADFQRELAYFYEVSGITPPA